MSELKQTFLKRLEKNRNQNPRPVSRKQDWFNRIAEYLNEGLPPSKHIDPKLFWYWANRNGKECIVRILGEMREKEQMAKRDSKWKKPRSRVGYFIWACKQNKTELHDVSTTNSKRPPGASSSNASPRQSGSQH